MNCDSVSSIEKRRVGNEWDIDTALDNLNPLWKRNFFDTGWKISDIKEIFLSGLNRSYVIDRTEIDIFDTRKINDFTLVYNPARAEWLSNKQAKVVSTPGCPLDKFVEHLDEMGSEIYTLDGKKSSDFVVSFNQNPNLERHLLIVSKKCDSHFGDVDHSSILDLANSSGYTVFINQKGSGAGVPGHLHYQAESRKDFPLMNHKNRYHENKSLLKEKNGILTYGLDTPNKSLLFKYESLDRGDNLVKIVDEVSRSEGIVYNLIYDISGIYFFPRERECPNNIPEHLVGEYYDKYEKSENKWKCIGLDTWKIAGQEMGHLISAKNEAAFNKMTYDDIYSFFRNITVDDKMLVNLYEKIMSKI